MTDTSSLAHASGSGLLARRPDAVLFAPADDADTLAEVFATAAKPGDALRDLLTTREFSVGSFAFVEWGATGTTLMVFGDLEVRTDHRMAPMLSGAGSMTWVEHRLPRESITVTVGAAPVRGTDLRDGIVAAGGFQLSLVAATTDPPSPSHAPSAAPDAPPSPASVSDDAAPLDIAPPVDPDDPAASLAAIQAAAVVEPSAEPAAPSSWSPEEPTDPGMTIVDDADPSEISVPLVEAKICPAGHPNPPTAAGCRICGALLAPGHDIVRAVVRPSLGRLRMESGAITELDRGVILGRNPGLGAGDRRQGVVVTGEKISRRHAEVVLQGWDVLVADLGSTNGTIVVPSPGAQPIQLDGDTPHAIEPGAVIYLGSSSVTFEAG